MLAAELDDHLETEAEAGLGNRRNGSSKITMLTGSSKLTLDTPRDRLGTFNPKLIAKYQRRFPDFDGKIISIYARGMTMREIRGHLEELYGIDVSPDLISTVTEAVLEPADTPDHLHNECNRDLELKAPPGGAHTRPTPG
jgi:putative transposase